MSNSALPYCKTLRLLLVTFALGGSISLLAARVNVALPYQVSYEEGNVLNAAARILAGESPYPQPGRAPYVFSPYGPSFYYPVAGLVKLFGTALTAPRLLIVLSTVFAAGLIGIVLKHWTGSRMLGFCFGLLYLSMPLVRAWMYVLRPDLLGIALTLAGLYVFAIRPAGVFFSIPFFVLALLCKPTFVAAPMACWIYLLLEKEWTDARRFILGLALTGSLGFACAELYTGKWLAFHLFWTHPDPYTLATLETNVAAVLLLQFAPIGLALWYVSRSVLRGSFGLPVLYFGCSLAAMIITAGKEGSSHNHGLEFLAAVTLCAGMGVHSIAEQMPDRINSVGAALGVLALASSVLTAMPQFKLHTKMDGCGRAYKYVVSQPRNRMLSENVGALVMAHKPVLVSNPFVYNQLIRRAGWSDGPLTDAVNAKSFDLILMGADVEGDAPDGTSRWPASVLQAVKKNYQIAERFECRDAALALEPRPTPVAVTLRRR